MKIVAFERAWEPGTSRCGVLLDDGATILDFASPDLLSVPLPGSHLAWFDLDAPSTRAAHELAAQVIQGGAARERARSLGACLAREEVRLLSPVPRPGKLICIGLNYRDHAAESGMAVPEQPVIFSKFTTSVIGPGEMVKLPADSSKVDYEAELGFVIGRRAKNVSEVQAYDYVFGYVNVNDVSARDFQFADGQWQRGKSCDTFAPMGEFIATKDEIADPHDLAIRLHLNGQTLQDSRTDQLIFGVPALVAFLSRSITLEPGDVVATGTPPGVGFARKPPVYLKEGDTMTVEIDGLGTLTNPVGR